MSELRGKLGLSRPAIASGMFPTMRRCRLLCAWGITANCVRPNPEIMSFAMVFQLVRLV